MHEYYSFIKGDWSFLEGTCLNSKVTVKCTGTLHVCGSVHISREQRDYELLNVVLFFAGRFLQGQGLQISLLSAASKADDGLGLGVPFCSVLVQAFFIRNKRDMINIQLKLLQMKKDEAEKRRLEAEAELKSLQGHEETSGAEVQALQQSLQQEAGKDHEQLLKEQEEHREKVLGEAEQVFGLLNERAKKASAEAEAQVKKWEEGDGGELLQAMSRGEGAAKLQQMLGQVDYRGMASEYAAQAQQMAGDIQDQAAA
ncbi:lip1 [Symbiodinium natans]|uniref:Lip1 protein n=1 Tax=Symbiodinium natans TaxID=878477 RepID=A0A812UQ18_9DINO|nr:lip1 [Symbiodinium natans]